MDCFVRLSSSQFGRFGDEQAAICGQSDWVVRYSDSILNFTGSGKIRIQCRQCNEKFVTEFSVDSRFKILSSEKEVRKHYDFFNSNIEIISAERDSSFLELFEDELIIFTKVLNKSTVRINLLQEVKRKNELLVVSEVELVTVDKKGKIKKLPKNLLNKL